MKSKPSIRAFFLFLIFNQVSAQSTFSPYSRYGIGEIAQPNFAHIQGMAGTFIALRPDSTMPNFVNVGNPASFSLIRLTTLELGLTFIYSDFKGNNVSLQKWTTNFAYGALGFPVGSNGGACFGIMPYTYVGSSTAGTVNEAGIGDVSYEYEGSGGLSKFFLGYGIMPFNKRLIKHRKKNLYIHDSLKNLSHSAYRTGEFFSKLLSDFSMGATANYVKGNIINTAEVIYPGSSTYYNTYRERTFSMADFTGNFGLQTAYTIDSVRNKGAAKRPLREKVKLTFGFTFKLNNSMNTTYSSYAYNYKVSSGQNVIVDTVFSASDINSKLVLPYEQGFGIGFKKGERLNLVADYAITKWQNFAYNETKSVLQENHRFSIGANFVPEKYASGNGSFLKRINYRMGLNFQTGYISINNNTISSYYVSAGLGIPLGANRHSTMVHVTGIYGKMGTTKDGLIQDNFWRICIGFTLSDKWFQKYRHD